MTEIYYLLRVLLALALGFGIGLERKYRLKEAGIRTHAIVAAGSALIMIVSKYGFADVKEYDASRVAAQIVSGIGFLGAGMILYRSHALQGLTTAAGIWMTAGVGMAVGAGLFILGICAAALIVGFQFLLHLPIGLFQNKQYQIITVRFYGESAESDMIREIFGVKQFLRASIGREPDGRLLNVVTVRVRSPLADQIILEAIKHEEFILSVDREEET